jgi:hypothetical protein
MSGVTLGHVMMLAALLAALYGLWQAAIWLRHRGFGRGTPQYAIGRDGRRFALWSFALALALGGLCLTPLCQVALGGGS